MSAIEVDPTFHLNVCLPRPMSAQQAVVLRRVGPGLAKQSPVELLAEWRQVDNFRLGPYERKYLADRAKSELAKVGITAEISSSDRSEPSGSA